MKFVILEAANMSAHAQFLSKHPYVEYEPEDLDAAKQLLAEETEVVRKGMQHGNITMDVYGKVWRDCYSQVRTFVFSSNHRNVLNFGLFGIGDQLQITLKRPTSDHPEEKLYKRILNCNSANVR